LFDLLVDASSAHFETAGSGSASPSPDFGPKGPFREGDDFKAGKQQKYSAEFREEAASSPMSNTDPYRTWRRAPWQLRSPLHSKIK
jgi:hypothetical protein